MQFGKGQQLTIILHEDKKLAPRYPKEEWTEVVATKAIITEKGTEKELPLVDFQMEDAEGNKYFFMVTGRIMIALAAAIQGVNVRNHGVPEP